MSSPDTSSRPDPAELKRFTDAHSAGKRETFSRSGLGLPPRQEKTGTEADRQAATLELGLPPSATWEEIDAESRRRLQIAEAALADKGKTDEDERNPQVFRKPLLDALRARPPEEVQR